MAPAIIVTLQFTVGALLFAIGVGTTPSQVTYLWRRPALMARSLLAMYLLVPLLALLLVAVLKLSEGAELALLVLAVAAGAPLLPKKLMGFGSSDYAESLLVNTSLLAVVVVPLWLAMIGGIMGADRVVGPAEAAKALAMGFALPLIAGLAARRFLGDKADATSEAVQTYGTVLLLVCAGLLLFTNLGLLYQVPLTSYLAVTAFLAGAVAIGHSLGGPGIGQRTTLGVSCGTRHLGVAIVIAAAYPSSRASVIVVGYLVCSAAVAIPYIKWQEAGLPAPDEGAS
jgi:BASS family bile acid:Na+ symporter